MLIEKAYAITFRPGVFDALTGGGSTPAVTALTGSRSEAYEPARRSEPEILADLQWAFDEHRAVTARTQVQIPEDDAAASRHGVLADHVYAPSAVDTAGGTIDMQNPHGAHHLEHLPVADFRRLFVSYAITSASLEDRLTTQPPPEEGSHVVP